MFRALEISATGGPGLVLDRQLSHLSKDLANKFLLCHADLASKACVQVVQWPLAYMDGSAPVSSRAL